MNSPRFHVEQQCFHVPIFSATEVRYTLVMKFGYIENVLKSRDIRYSRSLLYNYNIKYSLCDTIVYLLSSSFTEQVLDP